MCRFGASTVFCFGGLDFVVSWFGLWVGAHNSCVISMVDLFGGDGF